MLGTLFLFIGFATAEFDYEIHEKFITLPKHEFTNYFNSLNHSWTVTEYSEEINMHFGANLVTNHGLPTITHEAMDLPELFDSREQWPYCETIKEINKQGHCGSCYLFGTINAISDRTCIHTDVHVHLAEQEGDCMNALWKPCEGGNAPEVLTFWAQNGLVTEECKPYDIPSLQENSCVNHCGISSIDYNKDKHFGDQVYKVDSNIDAICAEIVKNGPVSVGFKVFEDFKRYHGGVYEHKFGKFKGGHAVRLIGFGVDENGVEYWLLANSWGQSWGENGLFRIKRGQPALELEENVFAGLPRREQ